MCPSVSTMKPEPRAVGGVIPPRPGTRVVGVGSVLTTVTTAGPTCFTIGTQSAAAAPLGDALLTSAATGVGAAGATAIGEADRDAVGEASDGVDSVGARVVTAR